jgi:DNA-binding transcriptional LysR family regulator
MHQTLNLQHLYALLEISSMGSISKAAESVHRSQSALTMAVRNIERAIGERLFERVPAGVFPTAAGRLFLARLERSFDWLRRALQGLPVRRGMRSGRELYRTVTSTQLRALIAVVQQGGFSLAARHLGLSQPSVHRAARDLELLLGQSLFKSATQGVEPTRAARRLARYASLAFCEIRQGLEEIEELRGRTGGRLSVASLPLARASLLPESISRILARHPGLQVRIVDGPYPELLQELRMGQVDLIVGALRTPNPAADVQQELLFEAPLSIVVRAGHPLLSGKPPGARVLARLEWVMPRAGTPAREYIAAYFERQGVSGPAHIVECSSLVATRGLLLRSDRAALLSADQVQFEVDSGILAVLHKDLPGTRRAIGLTTRVSWKPTRVQQEYVVLLRSLAKRYGGSVGAG